jgi:glycosyltransferase involved in cell wall biosynthesis
VEQYLHKCIDSILNQTFTDFELLLIDDGSPDKSGQICDEYAIKDSRIRVFHKENGGVSSARNLGLDNATGKWIAFIDSDDWVESTYLEHLLEGDEDVELRVMGIVIQNHKQKWKKYVIREESFLADDFWRFYKLYITQYVIMGPFLKLFLLSVINNFKIRFDPDLSLGEDLIFNLQYLNQIKSISVKKYTEYYYRHTELSLSRTKSIYKYEKIIANAEQIMFPLLNDKKMNSVINDYLGFEYCLLCRLSIDNIYMYQNLKPKERYVSLSKCFEKLNYKLNNKDISGMKCIFLAKGRLTVCVVCLKYIPIFIADVIFLFLFWLKRKIE